MKAKKFNQKGITIALLLMAMMICMPLISSTDFDNVKSYDPILKEASIYNCNVWLGTCLVQGDLIAKARLITPQINYVMPGANRKVAEFDIDDEARATVSAGESTFAFFFAKFINNICVEDIYQRFSFFKTIIFNNINRLFLEFVSIFPKFALINKNFDYLLKKKPTS